MAPLINLAAAIANQRPNSRLARLLRPIAAPGPRGVTISQVQISPVPVLQVGDRCRVNWTVTGVTTGVTGYRVDLMPVLPEQPGRIVGPPLATFIAPGIVGGTGATSTLMPRIRPPAVPPAVAPGGSAAFNAIPGLTPVPLNRITSSTQLTHLYVQPRVVALGIGGRPINAAGTFGGVVPLFPAGVLTGNFGNFIPLRGPALPVLPGGALARDPASAPAPGFSVFNFGVPTAPPPPPVNLTPLPRGPIPPGPGGFFSSWQSLVGASDPGPNSNGAFALLADRSAHGLIFSTNEAFLGGFPALASGASSNTAARTVGAPGPTAGNTVALVYEGPLPYPAAGTAGSPGVIRGFRVVGHAGFLDGGLPAVGGFANLGIIVEVSAGSTVGGPTPLPLDLTMTTVDSSVVAGAPTGAFFNYANGTPIQLPRPVRPGSPLMLLDVPIRFDLLDQAVTTGALPAYPTPAPVPTFPAGGANPFAVAPNPFGFSNISGGAPAFDATDFAAYQAEKAAGGIMTVRVTIFIDTSRAPGGAVGIFGLRLVPDIS